MRRIPILVSLILVLIIATSSTAFGALVLKESFPKDGGTDYNAMNFAVKLYFNQDVNTEGNQNAIQFFDEEKNKVDFTIAYSEKEEGLALIVVKGDLNQSSKYRVIVNDTFVSASGEFLEEPITLNFTTRDTSKDMTVNMALMGVMMLVVVVLSTKSLKKDGKDKKQKKPDEKVNPYKEARKKGKSVTDVVQKDQRAKERAKKAEDREKAIREKDKEAILKSKGLYKEEEENPNVKRVKAKRPIKTAGSTYVSGTKARAEAEAKREEARKAKGTTNPKKGKSKARKR